MIDPIWLAFGAGALIGAAVIAIVLWLVPVIREMRADRRFNAEVIDLATARLQREMRDDLRSKRGRR